MTMQELVDILSAQLNRASVNPYYPMDAMDVLLRYLKDEGQGLSEVEKELVEELARLFLFRLQQREVVKDNPPRFIGFTGKEEYPLSVWEFANATSDRLTHPVLGAFLDDLILFNRESRGPVSKINGFNFRSHFQRTIIRYLAKINWLRTQPKEEAHQFANLALSDAVERVAELCAQYGEKELSKQLLDHIKGEAQKTEEESSWRWLLPMVESFVRLSTAKPLAGEVAEPDQHLFLEYAKKCGEGFSEPGGLFHLIPDANALCRILAKQLGDKDAELEELKNNIRQIEKVADQRAATASKLAAATILDQALVLAHKMGNPNEVNRIADKQARYRREAVEHGEIKETMHEFQMKKEHWDQFLAPFVEQRSPEAALQLWIEHPSFLPDYKKLKTQAEQQGSVLAAIMSTSVLGGMGLQLSGEGEERTGEELHVALDVARMVQINTGLFLTPTLEYLFNELGVTAEIVKKKLQDWKLFYHDNAKASLQGVERHFAGDYVSSILILTTQFEALIRRAFHLAGVQGAIKSKISDKKGIEQQETTFGTFLSKTEVEQALGERLATHFRFVFSNDPGDKLMGLNIRNKVAHGIIEPESLNEATSTLVLHCILLLTLLKVEEVEQ